MTLEPLTQVQRNVNKAARLTHAADPNDGLTVRFLRSETTGHQTGDVRVVNKQKALSCIASGVAELAE